MIVIGGISCIEMKSSADAEGYEMGDNLFDVDPVSMVAEVDEHLRPRPQFEAEGVGAVGKTDLKQVSLNKEVQVNINDDSDGKMKQTTIYLIDDTAVRLNTFRILVEHLLRVGVRQVHCRFLSPKFLNPCFLGVNIGSRDELGAVEKDKNGNFQEMSETQIKRKLNVSSFHYLSLQGLAKSLGMTTDQMHKSHCTGCLDYHYPFEMRPYDPKFEATPYVKKLYEARTKGIMPASSKMRWRRSHNYVRTYSGCRSPAARRRRIRGKLSIF